MTVPRGMAAMTQKVSDMVRGMFPRIQRELTADEVAGEKLAVFLRGNEPLHRALTEIINARISGRASVPEPSDPIICKSMVARDRELQWLLWRLEQVYESPVQQAQEDGEQPA